jgi:predicted acyl esterase
VQSDCPDTDFVVKLIDVHPDGRAMLLMDGVIRAMYRDPSGEARHLAPDRVERLTINLGHICHTFGAGHRLEVDVNEQQLPAPCPQHQQRPSDTGERRRGRHSSGGQHHPPHRADTFVPRASSGALKFLKTHSRYARRSRSVGFVQISCERQRQDAERRHHPEPLRAEMRVHLAEATISSAVGAPMRTVP